MMSETTHTLDNTIAQFADAVRRHLDDLPVDDIDELTGGLEADLAEQAADHGGTLQLGDPALYATELRESAGLPARRKSSGTVRRRLVDRLDHLEAATERFVRSSALASWLIDFFRSLRPVWWILRGWAAYQLINFPLGGRFSPLPSAFILCCLLVAAIVVSVQWGRGKWLPVAWLKTARLVVSIITIIALPFLFVWSGNAFNSSGSVNQGNSQSDPAGLWVDGNRVANVVGYDAQGNPVNDLQLFDQYGNPLVTVGSGLVQQYSDFSPTPTPSPVLTPTPTPASPPAAAH
jgi:hypothetical protein